MPDTHMYTRHNRQQHGTPWRAALVVLAMGVAGCSSSGSIPLLDSDGFDWFSSGDVTLEENFSTYESPTLRSHDSDVELAISNAIELARQKRFAEARYILAEVRELQDVDSDAYEALTCSMAITALREGQTQAFLQTAAQLDEMTGNQVRVNPNYVEVISLYRAIRGLSLPVNAPSSYRKLRDKYFTSESSDV
jgi:hypothetical protein